MTSFSHLAREHLCWSGRWIVLVIAGAAVLAQIGLYGSGRPEGPIRSDGISYHVYLPAIVIHGNPTLWAVADESYGGAFPEYTGIYRWPNTSWWLNSHPIGAAVLALPFFLVAHVLTLWSNLPPDGFSLYYQIAASLAGLAYGAAGLHVLLGFLRRHVTSGVAVLTIVLITFGTNLFHYMTLDATYSHAFAFFLVAALVDTSDRWWLAPTRKHTLRLGAVAGLLLLTRHSHALLLVVPALWGLGGTRPMATQIQAIWDRRLSVLLAGFVAAILLLPQLAIYHEVTGHWFTSSYALIPGGQELHVPRVWDVWFSTQKGLFFWSPLLLVAVAGLWLHHPLMRTARWSVITVFLLLSLLIGGWHDWQFGGSYGHRGFTDILPLLAIPIAAVVAQVSLAPARVRAMASATAALVVSLSIFQMRQYWTGIIPFSDTTWQLYREVFLRWR